MEEQDEATSQERAAPHRALDSGVVNMLVDFLSEEDAQELRQTDRTFSFVVDTSSKSVRTGIFMLSKPHLVQGFKSISDYFDARDRMAGTSVWLPTTTGGFVSSLREAWSAVQQESVDGRLPWIDYRFEVDTRRIVNGITATMARHGPLSNRARGLANQRVVVASTLNQIVRRFINELQPGERHIFDLMQATDVPMMSAIVLQQLQTWGGHDDSRVVHGPLKVLSVFLLQEAYSRYTEGVNDDPRRALEKDVAHPVVITWPGMAAMRILLN